MSPAPSSTPASGTASSGATQAVDVQLLAEKVYRLMLADLSLELRRSSRPGRSERP